MKELKSLYQCYTRPSERKRKVYDYCLDKKARLSEVGFDILDWGIYSYNVYIFTFHIITTEGTYIITPTKEYWVDR